MRRGRIFIYLALILILGMVAVFMFWQKFLRPAELAAGAPAPTPVVDVVNVIVVTQKVPRGGVVEGSVLGMVPIPRDLFIQGMYSNINEVEGHMAKFDLDAGVPLTSGMLAESAEELSGTGSMAALSIPRGMVAVSIPIDRLASVSYALQPGDHVNVMVTLNMIDLDPDFQSALPNGAASVIAPGVPPEQGNNYLTVRVEGGEGSAVVGKGEALPVIGETIYAIPSESQRPRMVSQSMLQDAIVLNVGDFTPEGEEAADGQTAETVATEGNQPPEQGEQAETVILPETITLIVSPQDAITLNYLVNLGAELSLALRSAGDETRVATESVTLQFLLEKYNIAVPVKLPYGLEAVNGPQPEPTPVP
jgi:pilus assembly protein CpaB